MSMTLHSQCEKIKGMSVLVCVYLRHPGELINRPDIMENLFLDLWPLWCFPAGLITQGPPVWCCSQPPCRLCIRNCDSVCVSGIPQEWHHYLVGFQWQYRMLSQIATILQKQMPLSHACRPITKFWLDLERKPGNLKGSALKNTVFISKWFVNFI